MANRRRLFWLAFLGAAAALAVIPEFFDKTPEEAAQPVNRPRETARTQAAAQTGQLAELRSAASPATGQDDAASAAVPAAGAPEGAQAASDAPADRAPRPVPELFAAHTWYVPPPPPPPPPPAPPPPPPVPVAPPVPYEYLGKLAEGNTVRVFLVRGDRPYTVAEGDVLDGNYSVQRITDTTMTLVYLPLNMTQTLPVGSKP